MEVIEELLEGGADPNQADEVRAIHSLICVELRVIRFCSVGEQDCIVLG